jgi:hypothetical protein
MEDSTGAKIRLYIGVHFDRVSKENVDCVRVRSEKPKVKPELKQGTEEFTKVVKAIKNGYSMDDVKKKYTVSQDVEIAILEI